MPAITDEVVKGILEHVTTLIAVTSVETMKVITVVIDMVKETADNSGSGLK